MVAIVLTAAAQQNRRKAYIETKFGVRVTPDDEEEDYEPETIVGSDQVQLAGGPGSKKGTAAAWPEEATPTKGADPDKQPRHPEDIPAAVAASHALPKPFERAIDLEKVHVDKAAASPPPPRTPATPESAPLSPWPPGAPYPVERQISVRYPTVITPSEVAEDYRGNTDPNLAADQ
eukprot:jgi/Botrbrau1/7022/Bobra.0165s0048.1